MMIAAQQDGCLISLARLERMSPAEACYSSHEAFIVINATASAARRSRLVVGTSMKQEFQLRFRAQNNTTNKLSKAFRIIWNETSLVIIIEIGALPQLKPNALLTSEVLHLGAPS